MALPGDHAVNEVEQRIPLGRIDAFCAIQIADHQLGRIALQQCLPCLQQQIIRLQPEGNAVAYGPCAGCRRQRE